MHLGKTFIANYHGIGKDVVNQLIEPGHEQIASLGGCAHAVDSYERGSSRLRGWDLRVARIGNSALADLRQRF